MRDRLKPEYIVAIVYVAAMFVNILDTTVVTVALPTLTKEFDTTTASVQWVVTGYLLSLAVFIPASGWIGDKIGTKRTFLFAIAVFTGASALCGIATSLGELVAFRILQGVGGGMLTPTGFAMLMRAFPPERRAAASKVLIIPTAIAPASGPVVGGLLVDWLSWRWVFYVNLPLGIATFTFGWIFLTEHKEPGVGRFDLPGFLLSGSGLALILYGLSEGPSRGWASPVVWGTALAGLSAFAVLVWVEMRIEHPMLQLRLIGDRLFRSTMLTSTFSTGAFLGILFIMPLYLQEARGLSPVQAGLATVPLALMTVVASPLSGRIVGRRGPRLPLVVSGVCLVIASAMLTGLGPGTSLGWLLAAYVVFGAGFGLVNAPITNAAVSGMPRAQAGVASAIATTSRQFGQTLGVAVVGAIVTSRVGESVHADLSSASAPGWWALTACGGVVLALGLLATTGRAKASARRTAAALNPEALAD